MAQENFGYVSNEIQLTSFSQLSVSISSNFPLGLNKNLPSESCGNNDITLYQLHENGRTENGHVTKKQESKIKTTKPPHQLLFYINISFFAMCGCMARIAVDRLFGSLFNLEESGGIVNLSFFSNIIGCFVLGALNASPMGKIKLAALTKGLTTGFCGSFTTWSKWNQQLSLMLVGEGDSLNFIGGELASTQTQVLSIAGWFIGFYTFIGSYCVGWDFGRDLGPRIKMFKITKKVAKISEYCITFLLFLCVVGFIIGVTVDPTETGKKIWLAILLAPFGACLRSWFSQFKIDRIKLPLGTLLANSIGAIVLATLHVVDVRSVSGTCSGKPFCWGSIVLYAVGTGFCACLTTVSTFMSEIVKLRPEHPRFAYIYTILTVVVCQVFCGVINGVNLHYPYA